MRAEAATPSYTSKAATKLLYATGTTGERLAAQLLIQSSCKYQRERHEGTAYMINYQEEIKHFKPSLDVDNIEDAIAGMNLTDMNDLMMQLVKNAAAPAPRDNAKPSDDMQVGTATDDGYVNES